jgi:hypothetical protein
VTSSLQNRILKARPRAEKVLVDVCRVHRPAGEVGTLDRTTGMVTPPGSSVVYGPGVPTGSTTGKCLIGQRSSRVRLEGGQTVVLSEYVASLPAAAPELKPGDQFEVVTCALDTTLQGDFFEVGEPEAGSLVVLRLVPLRARKHSPPTEA